jgi:hypothetical protein
MRCCLLMIVDSHAVFRGGDSRLLLQWATHALAGEVRGGGG